ncbi:DUF983 domain-containing protein [Parafilimonas sp.]|uniref:DUF983 domain-containing protein n=1 Tax=Parafilimonas sp. TaxID=1969739 RepID=UPI0039E7284B
MAKGKPSYLLSVFTNRCPRCRHGDIFESKNAYALKGSQYMKMHKHCPVCGQPTEIEVGFYYGTGYVSYALGVAFSVVTFIAWWALIGISINDNRVFWWLGVNTFLLIVLQPVFMRLARSLWLSWFVKYDPNRETHKPENTERIIQEQIGNW